LDAVKIGFAAPVSGSWATRENLVTVARRAQELGYHELWAFQRLLSPEDDSWGPAYRSVLDPVAVLAYLAAHTSTIRLGVAVLNLPFMSPVLMAKQLSTVDIVAGGRLDVGLGVGWAPEEFVAVGVPIDARGRRAEEFVPLLRSLLGDRVVEHDGEFYRVPRSTMEPKPVQSPVPVLLGGGAEPALRRAGRLADGWISSSRADLGTLDDSVRIVREAAERAGRDPDALRFVCRGAVQFRTGTAGDRRPLTGTIEQIRGDFDGIAAQGVTELFVDPNFDEEIGTPDADPAESMRRAEELLIGLAPHQR
jgi:probable F420-dependent oxidoreductase